MPKTVLITGCSSGLGHAAAERFADAGWNVCATMRNPGCAAGVALAQRRGVLVHALDVTNGASAAGAVQAALARFGGLDVVVNNAGVAALGPLEGVSAGALARQLAVNVLGPAAVMRAALPHFRERRAGLFVNVGSALGRAPLPLTAAYAASKFALEGLSEAARMELAPLGVRVKLLEPGGVRTGFFQRAMPPAPAAAPYHHMARRWRDTMERNARESFAAVGPTVDVLWQAVTDGSDRLRYVAGKDAHGLLEMRKALSDEDYARGMCAKFGIWEGPLGTDATKEEANDKEAS